MDFPSFPNYSAASLKNTFAPNLLNSLPTALYICDIDGKITYYNPAAARLWGRRPEIGKDLWCGSWKMFSFDGSLLLPESSSMAITLRERRANGPQEFLMERPDGARMAVLAQPEPLFGENGQMSGAVCVLSDITLEKAKDAQLREVSKRLEKTVEKRAQNLLKSEERYHKMIEEVQDYAILLLDIQGKILNWNRGAQNIKGYSESEIVGKNFSVFYRPQDVRDGLPKRLIKEAAENGRAMHEGWRVRKDGSMFWGYIVITALHDDSGNVIGYSKVTRDLTEKKKADDRLKEYAEDIAFRNKQLEEFAYIASHDLQEPLRKIQTFAEILLLKIDDKNAVLANAEKISGAAHRMSVLIRDVLKYSQLAIADNIFEQTDLNVIVAEVLGDFELLIQEKGVVVNVSPLPEIKAIPVQLHQLFANLISNAIKFSDSRPVIDIAAQMVTGNAVDSISGLKPNSHYAKITVADNGIGFEPEYAEQVFKLFKRLNNVRSGTGIGLALCRRIVENHSGAISAASKPGKGTIFTVYLHA